MEFNKGGRTAVLERKSKKHVYITTNTLYDATLPELTTRCCSNTFHRKRDTGVPAIEKCLTLYLWRKLFPEQFLQRKYYSKWGRKKFSNREWYAK